MLLVDRSMSYTESNNIVDLKTFPDGTLNMLEVPYITPADCAISIIWKFENIAEQVMLYNLVQHYKNQEPELAINLVMPYIPNARMDRTKSEVEVNTLKWFCKFINDLNFYSVQVLDPHSDVSSALLDRCIVLLRTSYVKKALNASEADIIMYPDAGAAKRYVGESNLPVITATKVRNWKTGKIEKLTIDNPESVSGKTVLICDDICSKGGTFYYAAKELQKLGAASVQLYVSHCEDSIHEGRLLDEDSPVDHIYTTDSLIRKPSKKITEFPLFSN